MKTNLSISNFKMKKFIYKTSIFSLFVLIVIISVNYWGDSAHLFKQGYESKIAEIIFQNKNATNISNYDERILQKELIYKLKSKPDILILGSSRTMLINSSFFERKKVINNSVSGASIEDFIAIYQIYKDKNILPEKIILGIDPWLFNENSGQNRWLSLKEEYYNFINKKTYNQDDLLNNKTKQLFSFSYFQSSIKKLPSVIMGKSDPVSTDKIFNHSNTKLIDGSLSYGEKYRTVSNEDVKDKAKSYISSGKIYSIEDFFQISPKTFNEFEQLINDIQNKNIELSFFLAPYHPIVFEKISRDYIIVLNVEEKIKSFAKRRSIKVFGSFDPNKLGIDNSGFYDGMHSNENTIKKILKGRVGKGESHP